MTLVAVALWLGIGFAVAIAVARPVTLALWPQISSGSERMWTLFWLGAIMLLGPVSAAGALMALPMRVIARRVDAALEEKKPR